jgi:hypothetical protein
MLLLVLDLASVLPYFAGACSAVAAGFKLYRILKPTAVSDAGKPTPQKRTFTLTVSSEVK